MLLLSSLTFFLVRSLAFLSSAFLLDPVMFWLPFFRTAWGNELS